MLHFTELISKVNICSSEPQFQPKCVDPIKVVPKQPFISDKPQVFIKAEGCCVGHFSLQYNLQVKLIVMSTYKFSSIAPTHFLQQYLGEFFITSRQFSLLTTKFQGKLGTNERTFFEPYHFHTPCHLTQPICRFSAKLHIFNALLVAIKWSVQGKTLHILV